MESKVLVQFILRSCRPTSLSYISRVGTTHPPDLTLSVLLALAVCTHQPSEFVPFQYPPKNKTLSGEYTRDLLSKEVHSLLTVNTLPTLQHFHLT